MPVRVSVLDPRGVAPVDCQFENSGVFLEQLQAWFRDHLPTVKAPILRWRGEVYAHRDEETLAEVGSRGDAAILGVGL